MMKKNVIMLLAVVIISLSAAEGVTREKRKLDGLYANEISEDGRRQWKCQISQCDRIFYSSSGFKHHVDYDHGNKVYRPSLIKKDRTAEMLRGAQKVICPECGEERSRRVLKEHLKLVHGIMEMYPCRIKDCGREFEKFSDRNVHERVEHTLKVTGLFEDNSDKEELATQIGIYENYDLTDKPLLTSEQAELLHKGVKYIARKYKPEVQPYEPESFEADLKEYFIKKYTELGKTYPVKNAERLLQIYKDTPKREDTPIRLWRSSLVVPDDRRISIKRYCKTAIDDILTSINRAHVEGLAHYPTKEDLRQAFNKKVGKYYQRKFDEEMKGLGFDDEDKVLTAQEEAQVDAIEAKYKELKSELRDLFNKIPLHNRDKGYQLKHATYKVVE